MFYFIDHFWYFIKSIIIIKTMSENKILFAGAVFEEGWIYILSNYKCLMVDGKNMYLFCIEDTLSKLMNTPIISVINLSHCGVFSA